MKKTPKLRRPFEEVLAENERLKTALAAARPFVNSIAADYSLHDFRRLPAEGVLGQIDAALTERP